MPIHSDSSAPVLFFNMPVPAVQRLWLTYWGNKNLVLGGTGERMGLGFFRVGRGNFFYQVGGMSKFLAACLHPPSGIENPG